jgi:hypothetical protein
MTYSLQYLRQFMRGWREAAATTRIFFPDNKARVGLATAARAWAQTPYDSVPWGSGCCWRHAQPGLAAQRQRRCPQQCGSCIGRKQQRMGRLLATIGRIVVEP